MNCTLLPADNITQTITSTIATYFLAAIFLARVYRILIFLLLYTILVLHIHSVISSHNRCYSVYVLKRGAYYSM